MTTDHTGKALTAEELRSENERLRGLARENDQQQMKLAGELADLKGKLAGLGLFQDPGLLGAAGGATGGATGGASAESTSRLSDLQHQQLTASVNALINRGSAGAAVRRENAQQSARGPARAQGAIGGLAESLGNMVSVFRQSVGGLPIGNKAALEATLDHLLVASQEAAEKEKRERERVSRATAQTIMTQLPVFGTREELPDLRHYKLEDFRGEREKCEKNAFTCADWRRKLLHYASEQRLTEAATIKLMQRHTGQEAGRILAAAIEDGKGLQEIIFEFETNFCGLKHPDLAQEECRRMYRRDKETLLAFGNRVRYVAEMATRERPDAREAAKALAEDSFMNSLHPSLKTALRSKMEERERAGEPKAPYTEIMNEAHRLEAERLASEQVFNNRRHLGQGAAGIGFVRYSDDEDDPGSGHSGETKENGWDVIQELKAILLARQGDDEIRRRIDRSRTDRPRNPAGRFTKWDAPPGARPREGTRQQGPPKGNNSWGARRVSSGPAARGGASSGKIMLHEAFPLDGDDWSLSDVPEGYEIGVTMYEEGAEIFMIQPDTGATSPKKFINFKTLNVGPTECAKCGMPGHRAYANDGKCPLRSSDLQDQPCPSCKKGGHLAEECQNKLEIFRTNPKN